MIYHKLSLPFVQCLWGCRVSCAIDLQATCLACALTDMSNICCHSHQHVYMYESVRAIVGLLLVLHHTKSSVCMSVTSLPSARCCCVLELDLLRLASILAITISTHWTLYIWDIHVYSRENDLLLLLLLLLFALIFLNNYSVAELTLDNL